MATTLHNNSTIAGAGTIGKGGFYPGYDPGYLLNLDNQAGGQIAPAYQTPTMPAMR